MAVRGEKVKCNGMWTQARFNSFITSMLRSGTQRWAPIQKCKKDANVRRGVYLCAECKEEVPPTIKVGRKREKNIYVDHILPIVDPEVGFVNWDEYIERMFVEAEGLQLLCGKCHTEKTNEERAIAKARRATKKV